jgi:hypothetical protein
MKKQDLPLPHPLHLKTHSNQLYLIPVKTGKEKNFGGGKYKSVVINSCENWKGK